MRLIAIVMILAWGAQGVSASTLKQTGLTQADIDFFLEESWVQYGTLRPAQNAEDQLYQLAKENKSAKTIIPRFAAAMEVSVDDAAADASLIVKTLRYRKVWDETRKPRDCNKMVRSPIAKMIAQASKRVEADRVLLAAAENLDWPICTVRMMRPYKVYPLLMRRLYDYGKKFPYLMGALTGSKLSSDNASLLLAGDRGDGGTANRLALIKTVLEGPGTRGVDIGTMRTLAAGYLKSLLDAGLMDDALTFNRQHSQVFDQAFWQPLTTPGESDEALKAERYYADMLLDLSAAFIGAGNKGAATDLLALFPATDVSLVKYGEGSQRRRQVLAFLHEVMTPALGDNEVYDMFIDGASEKEDHTKDGKHQDEVTIGTSGLANGWLEATSQSGGAVRQLAAQYLSTRQYDGMARYALRHYGVEETSPHEAFSLLTGEQKQEAFKNWRFFRDRLQRQQAAEDQSVRSEHAVQLYTGSAPVYYQERLLPARFKHLKKVSDLHQAVAEGLKPPQDVGTIVRAARMGDEWVLICLSQRLDPTGEVSGGGYWVVRSTDHGTKWQEPLYLGLQEYFPYEVMLASSLPLITKDGLDIEVEIQEVDKASISFPPVGLRPKRQKKGLYLHISWKALEKDSDGDGLTDIYEYRIGLDPTRADSDGDGIPDGDDSLPLTPFHYHSFSDKQLAFALLKPIWGADGAARIVGLSVSGKATGKEDMDAAITQAMGKDGRPYMSRNTLILAVDDPTPFEGLQFSGRLFLYDPSSLKRFEKAAGVFYPSGIQAMFRRHDGGKYYVIWGAGWVGGSYKLVRKNGRYEVEANSSWIS